MLRFVHVLFVMTIIAMSVFAQAMGTLVANPYYYEIVYKGGRASHILGTIHVALDLSDLPSQVTSDLQQSNVVFAEMAFDQEGIEEELNNETAYYKKVLLNPDGSRASNAKPLNSAEINKLVAIGVPLEVAKIIPCDDLEYRLFFAKYVFPKLHSLDFEILDIAYKLNIPIFELDHPGVREDAVKTAPPEPSPAKCELSKALDDLTTQQLVEEVKSENEIWLSDYYEQKMKDEHDPSVAYRNSVWAHDKALINWLHGRRTTTFIAVGVKHLLGEEGLLALLRKEGFTVNKVQFRH